MVMPLSEALLDPLLAAAGPVVVAGGPAAGRVPIRWAHASEQLDVARAVAGELAAHHVTEHAQVP